MANPGSIDVDADLAHQLAERGGGGIAVFDADASRAEAGLDEALRALAALRHPEEPDDALVKYCSPIGRAPGGGVGASLDAPDLGAYELQNLVVETLTRALEDAGVIGRLAGIDSGMLTPIVPDGAPEPWTGHVPPSWLPLPTEALDIYANWWEGDGFVEFWTPQSGSELLDFYRVNLPPAGFELVDESATIEGEIAEYKLFFAGLGRKCRLHSGYRRRPSMGPYGWEWKVNIRCNLDR